MQPMLNAEPLSYRWQDHVIAPQHGAASLAATALIVLLVGAAVMFSVVDSTPPEADPAAHVSTEQTPPLVQLAKRPIRPRAGEAWL
jgi:hypothetical protein